MRGYAVRLTMIGIFVLHSMVCFTVPAFAQAVPEITAEAAVMLDMDTGEVLYGKAEHERRPPASLTKVMTGYLAAQRQELMHQEVVISELAAATGESSLNLKEKDVLCFEELLYGALLKSANDACVAVAEHISGSEGIELGSSKQA